MELNFLRKFWPILKCHQKADLKNCYKMVSESFKQKKIDYANLCM